MHINIVADIRRLIDEISNALNVGRWDITHEIAVVNGNTTTKPVKVIQKPATGEPNQPRNSLAIIVENRITTLGIADQRNPTTKIKPICNCIKQ